MSPCSIDPGERQGSETGNNELCTVNYIETPRYVSLLLSLFEVDALTPVSADIKPITMLVIHNIVQGKEILREIIVD